MPKRFTVMNVTNDLDDVEEQSVSVETGRYPVKVAPGERKNGLRQVGNRAELSDYCYIAVDGQKYCDPREEVSAENEEEDAEESSEEQAEAEEEEVNEDQEDEEVTGSIYSKEELEELDYSDLQDLAKEHDIKATQSSEVLIEELSTLEE